MIKKFLRTIGLLSPLSQPEFTSPDWIEISEPEFQRLKEDLVCIGGGGQGATYAGQLVWSSAIYAKSGSIFPVLKSETQNEYDGNGFRKTGAVKYFKHT